MGQGAVAIHQHDARAPARHQAVDELLQPPGRGGRREQDVAVCEDTGLAHVEHGDFLAVGQGLPKSGRCDQRMANRLGRAEGAEAAALQALEDHALGHALQAAPVEVQVQAGLLADQLDGVHVGGREHHRGSAAHIDAAAHRQVSRSGSSVLPRVKNTLRSTPSTPAMMAQVVWSCGGWDLPGRPVDRYSA